MKQNQIMRSVNRDQAFNLGEVKSSMQSCVQDSAFHKFSEVHSSKQMCAELSLLCKTLLQSSNLRVTIIYLQFNCSMAQPIRLQHLHGYTSRILLILLELEHYLPLVCIGWRSSWKQQCLLCFFKVLVENLDANA